MRLLGRGDHQRNVYGWEHIDEQLRVRRWLHGGCGGEWGELRGVHGGDVQEWHGLRGVYELPDQCGIGCRRHQVRMSCWIHWGRSERGQLHGVRSGDVQGWYWLCGVHELSDARGFY